VLEFSVIGVERVNLTPLFAPVASEEAATAPVVPSVVPPMEVE